MHTYNKFCGVCVELCGKTAEQARNCANPQCRECGEAVCVAVAFKPIERGPGSAQWFTLPPGQYAMIDDVLTRISFDFNLQYHEKVDRQTGKLGPRVRVKSPAQLEREAANEQLNAQLNAQLDQVKIVLRPPLCVGGLDLLNKSDYAVTTDTAPQRGPITDGEIKQAMSGAKEISDAAKFMDSSFRESEKATTQDAAVTARLAKSIKRIDKACGAVIAALDELAGSLTAAGL